MDQKGPGVDLYARHTPCDPTKELEVKKKCRVSFNILVKTLASIKNLRIL